ncbi:hypothetical protein CcaverHIS002_0205960 [Cutaneotrichosporon cavernicola]|uniref:C2 domain-containing protein n=1 Tax=Cutaneotrichosporon cavernicola TaxID=279322 RepID=A0AA48I7D9_9TREE|nr:uncharacterized protein CcaverHIS019_0205920 [Cutaneotrichosporon cavernicola]BEI81436.1 hypothetical protein CcaverHIS002_0205960 [Cutaneotrichosporon cavernicola]BEI89230.1 hypothetical protein CcaverHIS019_0205920 [Cutaneotrichosporon cavernicola]BEI97005.1 hypothetical protein CcaverHIS631_0205940 [Cutaneotrichosporon cavernicola]BEJ04779.1 hypothetical protein CcaverHIS641_0205960 [Cutaneotrichosporon cavernicola]
MGKVKKELDGGRDKTPLEPTKGPTYTLRVVFHSAQRLPISDFGSQSSDPFILAQCETGLHTRHKQDPALRFRSATARRTLNPRWDAEWVIAGIPATGCELKVRVYDEDNGTQDDLLGHVHVQTGMLDEKFKIDKNTYKLSKRGADWRAVAWRTCLKSVDEDSRKDVTLTMSLEVLERTKVEVGKPYTANCFWWSHYSPLLGRVVKTKAPDAEKEAQSANFQANQLQLAGPVPTELYHRYVDFKAFVPWMFESKGLRGRFLNGALHRQHESVYHYDAESDYGRLPGPGKAMGQRFLDMACWGEGKRIFTYVITVDGMMRFTETGPEFGIDMLSKHTMHSDVNVYIAYSGEFFVRKYRRDAPGEDVAAQYERNSLDIELEDEVATRKKSVTEDKGLEVRPRQRGLDDGSRWLRPSLGRRSSRQSQYDVPPQENALYGPKKRGRSTEPSDYELVIDNDSGTYRPDKELLPVLAKFLAEQFGGLHVAAMSCTDDINQEIKKNRLKAKAKLTGGRFYRQVNTSTSSLSSSDAEALEEGRHHMSGREKGLEFATDPVKFTKGQYRQGVDKVKRRKSKVKDGEGNGEGQGSPSTPSGGTPSLDSSVESPGRDENVGLNNAPPANVNPNPNSNAESKVKPADHDPEKI